MLRADSGNSSSVIESQIARSTRARPRHRQDRDRRRRIGDRRRRIGRNMGYGYRDWTETRPRLDRDTMGLWRYSDRTRSGLDRYFTGFNGTRDTEILDMTRYDSSGTLCDSIEQDCDSAKSPRFGETLSDCSDSAKFDRRTSIPAAVPRTDESSGSGAPSRTPLWRAAAAAKV